MWDRLEEGPDWDEESCVTPSGTVLETLPPLVDL